MDDEEIEEGQVRNLTEEEELAEVRRQLLVVYNEARVTATHGVTADTYRSLLVERYVDRINEIAALEWRRRRAKNIEALHAYVKTPEYKAMVKIVERERVKLVAARARANAAVEAAGLGQSAWFGAELRTNVVFPAESWSGGNKAMLLEQTAKPRKATPLGKVLAGFGYDWAAANSYAPTQIYLYGGYAQLSDARPDVLRLMGAMTMSRKQFWDELDEGTMAFVEAVRKAKTEDDLIAASGVYVEYLKG